MESFDYVIVGSGAAGSVLAARLCAEHGVTVCVLEAGPSDWHPWLHIPAGFIKVLGDSRFTWPFSSEASAMTGNRRIPLPQGRTLGGSTAINGMVYNRGQAEDFDQWEAAGNEGWGFESVLPYFKKTETRIGFADEGFAGRAGPLTITRADWQSPLCEAFIQGAQELGIPRNGDYNGATQIGAGYFQRTISGGLRKSAASAFLRQPIKKNRNLRVIFNAQATEVVIENHKAVGVRYVNGESAASITQIRARKEVILCAGTINTPKLLQLSGVGDGKFLSELGIPVKSHLEGVGSNLRDHLAIRGVAQTSGVQTINELSRLPMLAWEVAKWVFQRPNILSLSPSLVHWFWDSTRSGSRPDIQGVFSPASYKEGSVGQLDQTSGMTCGLWQHRPKSSGFVKLSSTHFFDSPVVQPNYLSEEHDRNVLLAGMRMARRLLNTSALSPYRPQESLPGADRQSDEELLAYVREYCTSSYHLVGTARMGPKINRDSVVDSQLRVYGVEALRVVDASIMPNIPSANTCAATMMIAEKAAEMIIRPRKSPEEHSAVASQRLEDKYMAETSKEDSKS